MKIYHKFCNLENNNIFVSAELIKLPLNFQNRIKKYSSLQKQIQRIMGLQLLKKAIIDLELNPEIYNLNTIQFTKNGKPFFDEKVNYNLAYADKYSVLAISCNKKVGIDIEKKTTINLDDYKNYFTEKELEFIQNSADSTFTFYKLWTRKEALSKAVGLGMLLDFKTLEVLENNIFLENKWKLTTEIFNTDYVLSWVEEVKL